MSDFFTAHDGRARPRAVLADPHRIVTDGLSILLAPSLDVVATASNANALIKAVRTVRPDLIITEVWVPEATISRCFASYERMPPSRESSARPCMEMPFSPERRLQSVPVDLSLNRRRSRNCKKPFGSS
jgi:hypothetical protein